MRSVRATDWMRLARSLWTSPDKTRHVLEEWAPSPDIQPARSQSPAVRPRARRGLIAGRATFTSQTARRSSGPLRRVAFRATEEMDETANYQDTLDYANYGVNQSVAVLAQRAAIDVLDKIAGFASEYLGLQGDAHRVYFASRWQTPPKQKNGAWEWQPAVAAEISAGNPAALALGDLASDLTGDGYLSSHRLLRHTGTHRFAVLHDMLPHTPRPSPFIEHHRQFDFERTTVKTLQMCRAALTYAREMVLWRERRSSAAGKHRARMYAPPHHEIRGLKPRMRKR